MNTTNEAYKKEIWDQYARAFLSVMPSTMLELNKAVAELATGNVCDFGCGAAKIAPFALDQEDVTSYTGVDYSSSMVDLARWHLAQFPEKPSTIIHGKIESIDARVPLDASSLDKMATTIDARYDFGLSINSYYAWDAPETVLKSIYNNLKPNACFVLVTPNPTLDMLKIFKEIKKEQVANPYFETFMEQNIALAGNEKALFVEMNELILQVQKVGFKVIEAKQCFYGNGLNFLYLST
jgi:SAM-dependent methyltransferase